MPEPLVTPRLLSKANAAHYSGVSPRTVETWIHEKAVASRMVGHKRLIEKNSLDRFLDSAELTPADPEINLEKALEAEDHGTDIGARIQGYLILVPIRACTKQPFGLSGPDGSQEDGQEDPQ